ncbi:sensor histidine kinase [Aeromicrobium sp. CF4.19]|uniref:sensor histidine kinase n=1 Tax=Aeromicrobium sp. CF4.19 TaxID=3373082 RepID=UPI003EE4EB56
MNRVTTWWNGLSDTERFRFYTRFTVEVAIAGTAVVMAASMRGPWQSVAAVVCGVAALLALEARPELTSWTSRTQQRWLAITAVTLLAGVTVAAAVLLRSTEGSATVADTRTVGLFALILAVMAVVAFLPHRWLIVIGLGVASGPAFGESPMNMALTAVLGAGLGVFAVGTMVLTLWGIQVVDDLERARSVEAELQVTQERLRFARDLHDVVGRGFSAIAVKSELAAALSRAGAPERAAAEMDEVKAVAVDSMEQMRSLVRGYRDISLAAEVAGARSLLSAAGCHLDVQGEAAKVPQACHEVAAWVVREGTTNIVKHTSAKDATLTLGVDGMSLRNDDAGADSGARSGQIGLAERLAEVGATMTTAVVDDHYVLEVRWATT